MIRLRHANYSVGFFCVEKNCNFFGLGRCRDFFFGWILWSGPGKLKKKKKNIVTNQTILFEIRTHDREISENQDSDSMIGLQQSIKKLGFLENFRNSVGIRNPRENAQFAKNPRISQTKKNCWQNPEFFKNFIIFTLYTFYRISPILLLCKFCEEFTTVILDNLKKSLGNVLLLRNTKMGLFDPPPPFRNPKPYKCLPQCTVLSQRPDTLPVERYVIKERSLTKFTAIAII